MRITNTMITSNTKSNINNNKLLVDKYNTQMTTQKKISKASENPVIAIRSLRLSTTMSRLNQYTNNNIPDASAWMDVTETALTNMKDLLREVRTLCVQGSSDTLNQEDRQTILETLRPLCEQIYAESNADYAGKTVFTGFRSSSNLTFDTKELDTEYNITQSFDYKDLEEKRYYTGTVAVPEAVTSTTADCTTAVEVNVFERIRLAYGGDTTVNSFTLKYTDANGAEQTVSPNLTVYETETEWEAQKQAAGEAGKVVGDDEVVYIEETGEFIFGKNVANMISDNKASMEVNYNKKGFQKGEARPEYYYDCVDVTDADPAKHITYKKESQEIVYNIASSTAITINTQAEDVLDTGIARDVEEMINLVQKAIDASNKVKKLQEMMAEDQYADEASQKLLQGYLDVATKEADYAEDNLQKSYEKYISRFDKYMEKVNIAITNVGGMQNNLNLTKARVQNQQVTIEELKSANEDRDISDIIIDYYAAYNAYTSSLQGASKVGKESLLNYI